MQSFTPQDIRGEVLSIKEFGVTFAQKLILANITLSIPRLGVVNLVGPSGTGKSTLIRTIGGLNDAQPVVRTWGSVSLFPASGPAICDISSEFSQFGRHVALVIQNAKFLTATVRENLASALPNRSSLTRVQQDETLHAVLKKNGLEELIERFEEDAICLPTGRQRRLAIVQASLGSPSVLCVDECTAGLNDSDANETLALLARQATERAVIFVTHNQQHAQKLGGRTVLLAGGHIQEEQDTKLFFSNPLGKAASSYVRTGSCSVAAPSATREELSDSTPLPPALSAPAIAAVASRYVGPTGFFWIIPGKLGGLPRPGIVSSVEDDLAGLTRLGVNVLVTLEEKRTVASEACAKQNIDTLFFPIIDMETPTHSKAQELGHEVQGLMDAGKVVAMHCRAGMGRTGLMLACQLIWQGMLALEALQKVRGINPKFIQSEAQAEFLSSYRQWLSESTHQ